MAKPGLNSISVHPFLRDAAKRTGWALCIGAGTSLPVFPTWDALVTRLISRDIGNEMAHEISSNLLAQFSPDALIQAGHDRLALSEGKFAGLLSDELYSSLRKQLLDDEWDLMARAFSAYRAAHLSLLNWGKFLKVAESHFNVTTAWPLARILSRVIGTEIAPAAILSFNAEPILFTLTTAMLVERDARGSNEPSKGEMRQYLDLVNRSIAVRMVGRVPYIFCHGLLPVPQSPVARSHMASTDKLVFSEAAYLELANLSFSWQSSAFLDVCASRRTVFVGVSLSDPNMRRWLGWLHANRRAELAEASEYEGSATYHIWIRKEPRREEERRWIEASVAHLGIRLVWIQDWPDVGLSLSKMLGVPL